MRGSLLSKRFTCELRDQVFQVLHKWQPTRRNRVESTGLLPQIQAMASGLSGSTQRTAQDLAERWAELPLKYTIPRKELSVSKT